MDLLKINSNGEEIIRMSGKEVEKINSIDNFNKIENTKNTETPENSEIPKNPEGVKGGFAIVSDPIYKLTYEEEKGLGAAGYNLKRTNSGNYRITNEDGKMASPLEIQTLCKVINRSKNKNKSVWTYIFHM